MPRRLTRNPGRGVVAGVAAGFGAYLDVDPVIVRLAFVLLAFWGGFGVLAYLVAWVVTPKEAVAGPTPLESAIAGVKQAADAGVLAAGPAAENARRAVGWALMVLGALLLFYNLDWIRWPRWANLETLWPVVLIAMGFGLVRRAVRPEVAHE
jgi:phage shock protein PspC (stress-responsive transcriptional regulator)